jgi:hypothetical protein
LEQNFFDPVNMGAVRIIGLFALGMVFAVDRGPFFGHLTRRQPQPKTKEMGGYGVQIKRAVGLVAVKKDGDTDHRDMGHCQGKQHNLPPA